MTLELCEPQLSVLVYGGTTDRRIRGMIRLSVCCFLAGQSAGDFTNSEIYPSEIHWTSPETTWLVVYLEAMALRTFFWNFEVPNISTDMEYWLVVSTYPSEKDEFVSWDDEIPNWMEK